MRKTSYHNIFASLLGLIALAGCTSNLNYRATQPSSSLIEEMANAAGVDAVLLKQSMTEFIENGGLRQVSTPEQFPILACVADSYHDGVLNLSDVVVFARHFGKTCAQIAAEAQSDSEIDNNISCPNLFRDPEHVIDMKDLDTFIELYRERPDFNTNLCNDAEAEDGDNLSPYTEAFAWLNTDPLDPETYEIPDYDYYMNIIGGGDSSCGNGIIEDGEQCDGNELNETSCSDFEAFSGGVLSCSVCAFNFENCIPQEIGGQPSISSAPNQISEGQAFTVEGVDFGSKAHAPPLRWLDFDDGSSNTTINEPGWNLMYHANCADPAYSIPHYSNEQMRDGSLNGKFTGERGDCYQMQGAFTGLLPSVNRKIYVSFYHWVDRGNQGVEFGDPPFQQKSWRFYADNSDHLSYPTFSQENLFYPPNDDRDNFFANTFINLKENNCPGGDHAAEHLYHATPFTGTWQYNQVVVDLGDRNATNGKIEYYVDCNKQGNSITDIEIYCDGDQKPTNFIVANYYGLGDGSTVFRNNSYYDDIYVDDTWQRVEIGDQEDYDSCSHREAQIPVTWSGDRIVLTANQGTFLSGDTVYLFVTDANNNHSAGFPITIQ